MNDEPTLREKIIAANAEHPEWTARQIAENLGIERHHVYNHAYAAKLKLAPAPMLPSPRNTLPAIIQPTGAPADMPSDFTVFADTPAGMVVAQEQMVGWCDQKIAAACGEQEDARRNAFEGSQSGFSVKAWDEMAAKIGKRIDFYEKVKAALQAGYYIVPPFPIDIFAIRTKAKNPKGDWQTRNDLWAHRQIEQMLPAGEGRYVAPAPLLDTMIEKEGEPGKERPVKYWKPSDFVDVVDFPFALAPAEVMNATSAAMALKIFDRLGVLPSRKSPDPIICGQILMPHRGKDPLTFFVTWWLDTKTL